MNDASYRWSEIVNDLVSRITSGEYPVNSLLPSVRQLKERWSCSDSTAQRALRELADRGWARAEPRRGYVVISAVPGSMGRETRPDTSPEADASLPGQGLSGRTAPRLTGLFETQTLESLAEEPGGQVHVPQARLPRVSQGGEPGSGYLAVRPPVVVQVGSDGPPSEGAIITALEVHHEAAPAEVALALQLPEYAPVVVRRRIFADQATGISIELRVSYLRESDARGTALSAPEVIDGSWTSALAQHLRRSPTDLSTSIRARRAEEIEANALGLAPNATILVHSAVANDAAGPFDLTRRVWASETTTLVEKRHPAVG